MPLKTPRSLYPELPPRAPALVWHILLSQPTLNLWLPARMGVSCTQTSPEGEGRERKKGGAAQQEGGEGTQQRGRGRREGEESKLHLLQSQRHPTRPSVHVPSVHFMAGAISGCILPSSGGEPTIFQTSPVVSGKGSLGVVANVIRVWGRTLKRAAVS